MASQDDTALLWRRIAPSVLVTRPVAGPVTRHVRPPDLVTFVTRAVARTLVTLVTLVLLATAPPTVRANPDARRLYDDLLSDYNRLIRPVFNASDRVTVKLGLRLSQLMDLVSQKMTMLLQLTV